MMAVYSWFIQVWSIYRLRKSNTALVRGYNCFATKTTQLFSIIYKHTSIPIQQEFQHLRNNHFAGRKPITKLCYFNFPSTQNDKKFCGQTAHNHNKIYYILCIQFCKKFFVTTKTNVTTLLAQIVRCCCSISRSHSKYNNRFAAISLPPSNVAYSIVPPHINRVFPLLVVVVVDSKL